ncbi:hypothetical protein BYT27DRAFT_6788031 [Phlegmacium glaucopus]|nr:hypothetical protein BYT27DRAFT_6788031 [Phlegmacium glaucopus]
MYRHTSSLPNVLVLTSGESTGQAGPSHQQPREQGNLDPITHASEINTSYFHCQEHRYFYPCLNYEVVKVQTTDRNAYAPGPLTSTFHILNFPIDQLSEYLMAEATQLFNLRSITFHSPLSWEVLMDNYTPIMGMTLSMLHYIPSLTRITLCADMLNHALFHTLCSQLYLREVEILLPSTVSFYFFPDMLAGIGEVLDKGITRLSQVKYFKIPLEIVTDTLLSCLGRLPYLHFLETTGSANAPYPGRFFTERMGHLHIRNRGS